MVHNAQSTAQPGIVSIPSDCLVAWIGYCCIGGIRRTVIRRTRIRRTRISSGLTVLGRIS